MGVGTRKIIAATITAFALATTGCMSEREAADLDFRDALQEIGGDMGAPPPGMRGRYGGVLDWIKKQAGNLANKAANFALCKVLKGNARDMVYLAGMSRQNSLIGFHGAAGREIAFDLTNYQATAYTYKAPMKPGTLAGSFAELRGGVYSGLLTGKHSGVTDLVGPHMLAGVNLPAPIPLIGRFLKSQVRYVRASTGHSTMQGATVGLAAGLSIDSFRLGPIGLGFFLLKHVRLTNGNWKVWNEQTEKIARRDASLGAKLHNLDQQCPLTEKTSYVSYEGSSHTERAKRLAKAMVNATKVDPIGWAMVPLVTALGIARDRGGVDYLCGDGAPHNVPLPTAPRCPSYGAPRITQPPTTPPTTPNTNTPPKSKNTPPADTESPKVKLTSPKEGAKLSSVEVRVQAKDNVGVEKVELYIDTTLKSKLTSAPWIFKPKLTPGNHHLLVRAVDKAGNQATDFVTVNVTSAASAGGSGSSGSSGSNAGSAGSGQTGSGKATPGAGAAPARPQPRAPGPDTTVQGSCSVSADGRLIDTLPFGTLLMLGGLVSLGRRRRRRKSH